MGICMSETKKSSNVRKIPSTKQISTNNTKPNLQGETNSLETNQEIIHIHNPSDSSEFDDHTLKKDLPIKIMADYDKVQYPIYLQKGQEFSFTIISGKWSFLPEYGETNYEGHPQIKHNNINIGALSFQVLGGQCDIIHNKIKYIADSSGPLFFFAHCDMNDISFYSPQGFIELTIQGGIMMPLEKIDSLCGWKITTIHCDGITMKEKEVIMYINKLRTAPSLFGKMYMNNQADQRYKDFNRIFDQLTPLPQLNYNESLTKAAKDHANDLGDNGITGHLGSNSQNIKNRIHLYEKRCEYFGENCSFNLGNSLSIAIDMIVDNFLADKYNQNNILNPSFTDIGICIRKHQAFKWCCVIIFGKLP